MKKKKENRLLKLFKSFFWKKFNPNWHKITCYTGFLGGGIWCVFTLMDLRHTPYWTVSAELAVLNAIYFLGKFCVGLYILLESARR